MPSVPQIVLENLMLLLNPEIEHISIPLLPDKQLTKMIFEDVTVRLPKLQSLDMRFGPSDMSIRTIQAEVLSLLGSLQSLKDIGLPYFAMTSEIITVLACLPNLVGLDHTDDPETHGVGGSVIDVFEFTPHLEEGFFPRLERYAFAGCLKKLDRVLTLKTSPWNLTTLAIMMVDLEPALDLQQVLQTLTRVAPGLVYLSIEPYEIFSGPSDRDGDERPLIITIATLRPLASFSDLDTLYIEHHSDILLSDTDFDWLMSHFPRLQEFQLISGSTSYRNDVPLTICAISALARHCQDLRIVVLDLKGSLPAEVDAGFERHSSSGQSTISGFLPHLHTLHFWASSIEEPVLQIAIYLSNFLPLECEIESQNSRVDDSDEEMTDAERGHVEQRRIWGPRWEEVGKLVPLLVGMRQYEREKMAVEIKRLNEQNKKLEEDLLAASQGCVNFLLLHVVLAECLIL